MTQESLQFEKQAQNKVILRELQSGKRLTSLDILWLCGSMRASGRIYDLRHGEYDGTEYPIEKDMIKVGRARVAQYRLEAQQ